jgi:nucleotide-binding universal stress UspA family protein
MYRSILVPLDGSTSAEHALPIAASIARRAGAELQLVHVHVPKAEYVDGKMVFNEVLDAQLREHQHRYLEEITKKIHPGFPVTRILLEGQVGQIAECLDNHIKTTQIDLVVMATHGRGTLARLWLGSVADKFVRQVEIPIVLIRPQETKPDLTQEPVFRHILIPLDGSALAEQILKYALALGKLMQSDYTLFHVMEPWIPVSYRPDEYSTEFQQLRTQKAQAYLNSIVKRLRTEGNGIAETVQVRTKITINHYPAVAILEEANQHKIDLIAMETHGHGGLIRLLIGSVADKVLRGTSIPILLHRPHPSTS